MKMKVVMGIISFSLIFLGISVAATGADSDGKYLDKPVYYSIGYSFFTGFEKSSFYPLGSYLSIGIRWIEFQAAVHINPDSYYGNVLLIGGIGPRFSKRLSNSSRIFVRCLFGSGYNFDQEKFAFVIQPGTGFEIGRRVRFRFTIDSPIVIEKYYTFVLRGSAGIVFN